MTILATPETSLEDRLCDIEALIKEVETFQDTARKCECIQRIDKLISEAYNFLDIEARHGGDIETTELDILRDFLNYAIFNNNMIAIETLKKNLDANMSKLPDLRIIVCNRIYTTKHLLAEMMPPIQSPLEELMCEGYIKRIYELTQEANTETPKH